MQAYKHTKHKYTQMHIASPPSFTLAMATDSRYTIQVITDPNELVALTAAQYGAFINTDNVLHETLFPPAHPPSQEEVETSAKRHQSTLASDPNAVFIKAVDSGTGDVAGYAKWYFYPSAPERPKHVEASWLNDSTPEGKLEKDFAQKTWDEFYRRRVEEMDCPHALLDLCFTTPEYERKGVASLLVGYGLEKADREGWACFTEASPRGKRVYERLGFVSREEVRLRWDEEGDWWRKKGDVVWSFLERPVKKKV